VRRAGLPRLSGGADAGARGDLHGSDARQRAIADGLNRLVEGELQGPIRKRSNGDAEHDRARGGHAGKGRPRDVED
jgi:hypothetical protein